jgi:outer membrane autotransporter protein
MLGLWLKLGYDWKPNLSGYVTPYAACLVCSSLAMIIAEQRHAVDGQSYDSLRYELGVDTGYTFNYGGDQALTPYFKLAYVYDDADNNADINGDSIDNGVKGSAVRVGLGTSSASPRTSVLTRMPLIWAAATLTRTGAQIWA